MLGRAAYAIVGGGRIKTTGMMHFNMSWRPQPKKYAFWLLVNGRGLPIIGMYFTSGRQARAMTSEQRGVRLESGAAAVVLAGLYGVSAVVMALNGLYGWGNVAYLAGMGVFTGLTVWLTRGAPPVEDVAQKERDWRVWAQIGFILVMVGLTGLGGLEFHRVVQVAVPGWDAAMLGLGRVSGAWLGNDNYLVNPTAYFVLPMVGLLLLGADWRSLGFEKGWRVWAVVALWAAIPVGVMVFAWVSGQVTLVRLGAVVVSHSLQNGFFEEFLFRGTLQTRLARVLPLPWAVVVQGVVFGVWHLGLGFSMADGAGLGVVLATTVVYQGVMGVVFGVLMARTRNLIAPSVVHVVLNSMGSF